MNGKLFRIHKFRSMVRDAENLGAGYTPKELNLVPPLGRFLRLTSLDELPQLMNILLGDMSFIGPRPALPSQFSRYTREQARRVEVPQGLTGLAQIRYRQDAPWSLRIKADLEYVENISPRLDWAILLRTPGRVFNRQGVRHDQTALDVDDLSEVEGPDSK